MSLYVASYFICCPRASSASATSASSPIEAAPLSCRCVSLLFTQFHGKPNPNPRPHQSPSPYGAALTAVDRWSLSNDSRRHNSSSVPHPAWPRLHEIIRPHTALSPRFRAFRRSVSPLRPDILFLFPPRLTSAIDSSLCTGRRGPSAPALTTPANFDTPYSLPSICIGPASAAPSASF